MMSFYTFVKKTYRENGKKAKYRSMYGWPPAEYIILDMEQDPGFPRRSTSCKRILAYLATKSACTRTQRTFEDCLSAYGSYKTMKRYLAGAARKDARRAAKQPTPGN